MGAHLSSQDPNFLLDLRDNALHSAVSLEQLLMVGPTLFICPSIFQKFRHLFEESLGSPVRVAVMFKNMVVKKLDIKAILLSGPSIVRRLKNDATSIFFHPKL